MIQTIFCTTNLLILISCIISTYTQGIMRTATLTPTATSIHGVNVISNIQEVTKPNNAWFVNVLSQSSWHFILSLDTSWGFSTYTASSITLTINSPAIHTTDLLFGFTTNNLNYISMAVPMDNTGRETKIYPACDTMTAGMGDIAALPDFDRNCDIAGGSCTNWHGAPFNTQNLALTSPITLTLENDPLLNVLSIYLGSVRYNVGPESKCTFAAMSLDEGLKIYISGNDAGQTFIISSFDIVSTIKDRNTATERPITTTTLGTIPVQPMVPIDVVPPPVATTTTTQAPLPSATTSTTTAAPITTQVVTAGPGQEFGAFGQLCAAAGPYTVCQSSADVASQTSPGFTKCERDYDCCLCASVQCGNYMEGCRRFSAGAAGVFSVKSIDIQGEENGATIDCFGVESCALSDMKTTHVVMIRSANDYALKNAKIQVLEPVAGFGIDCIGTGSCEGLQLDIEIVGPPDGFKCNPANPVEVIEWDSIRCGGIDSCKDMKVTVTNNGCDTVEIGTLECITDSSCTGASLTLNGDVHIQNCLLTGTAGDVTGIDTCFENLESLLCPDPVSCRDSVRTLNNPANGFILNCADVGSCAGAQMTFNMDINALEPVQYFDGIKFSGIESGAGATLIFNNNQHDVFLEIERVECTAYDACVDTTFIIGNNVQIGDISCNAGTCKGCRIKRTANSVGMPCDPTEIPAFTNPNEVQI